MGTTPNVKALKVHVNDNIDLLRQAKKMFFHYYLCAIKFAQQLKSQSSLSIEFIQNYENFRARKGSADFRSFKVSLKLLIFAIIDNIVFINLFTVILEI